MWKAYFMGLTRNWNEEKVCPHKCGKKEELLPIWKGTDIRRLP
jgi:hypothetical protein